MKKSVCLIIIWCCFNSLLAQEKDINFSVFGGIGISNGSFQDDFIETNGAFSLNGGFILDYNFNELFTLNLNVSYNQNGWVVDESISDRSKTSRTLTIHYITVATAPQVNFGEDLPFYASLGPYISFLAGANQGFSQVRDDFESNDFGLLGRFGCKFPVGNNSLFVEVAPQIGLSNILIEDVDAKNIRGSLNFGFQF